MIGASCLNNNAEVAMLRWWNSSPMVMPCAITAVKSMPFSNVCKVFSEQDLMNHASSDDVLAHLHHMPQNA